MREPMWDDMQGWRGDNLTLGMQVRNARGPLSQTELARRVGISPSYVVRIEADERRPSAKVWDAIAAVIPVDREAFEATRRLRRPRHLPADTRLREAALALVSALNGHFDMTAHDHSTCGPAALDALRIATGSVSGSPKLPHAYNVREEEG